MKELFGSSGDATHRLANTCAADFDLEVWKAQQQARFRSQLRQAKEKLQEEVLLAVKEDEKKTIDELENRRRDLEKMAKRLQSTEEALQRRARQLELHEAAFEARRVKVAEQHESHLNRVEQRAKHTVEEALARQSFLKTQLSEKDSEINCFKERLQTMETEYDLLQRKMTGYLTNQMELDSKDAKEREEKLAQAMKTTDELRTLLSNRTQLVERLWRENEELQTQLEHLKLSSQALFGKYTKLLNMWYAREYEQKQKELDRLENAIHERQSCQVSDPKTFSDPLYRMLRSLKKDIESHLRQTRSVPSMDNSPPHNPDPGCVCMECPVAVSQSLVKPSKVLSPQPTERPPSPTTTICVIERKDAATNTVAQPLFARDTQLTERDISYPFDDADKDEHASADTSTSSYKHVEIQSWHSEEEGVDPFFLDKIGAPDALPPLAPAPVLARNQGKQLIASPGLTITPTPEDFAQAAQVGAPSVESARAEMQIFTHQLKTNRQKLLETGVYNKDHAIIREMDEKISLYEEYLSVYR